MRLPFSKVYRAFPELDAFSDEECRRYVKHVRKAFTRAVVVKPFVWGVLGCLPWVVAWQTVDDVYIWTPVGHGPASTASILVGAPAFFLGSYFIARDAALRRALVLRIKSARCRRCEFALIGLPVRDGAVRCPECGEQIVLAEQNLTEEDLLVRREPVSTASEEFT